MPCELRALAVCNETHVPWPAEPSRVPGGPTPAVRNMGEQMFPIIRRPYGCLLCAGLAGLGCVRVVPWQTAMTGASPSP
jgi:hypothetical protein